MTNKVNQAGDVNFEFCEINKFGFDSIDIINQVEAVIIYEDLFSPFITGELSIIDTLDLPNVFGRSGRDTIRMKIFTPSIDKKYHIDGRFFIYKVSDKTESSNRAVRYKIYFTSDEFKVDVDTHLSKKFKGSSESIVKNVVEKYFYTNKKFKSDKTSSNISFVSNFWTPSKCISYISEHTLSDSGIPGFLFYENRDGFNFRHIHSIAGKEQKSMQEFSTSDFVAENLEGETGNSRVVRDPIEDYTIIKGIRVDVNYDFLKDYLDGIVNSKMYSSDIITKKVRWNLFDMNKKGFPNISKNNLYTEDVVKDTTPIILLKNRGYGTYDISEHTNYAFLQKRIALMNSIQSSKIEIDVYGRTDYTIGRKVSINSNQNRNISKNESPSDYIDKTISGDYIITAIAHQVTRVSHKCTMELCKDSTIMK